MSEQTFDSKNFRRALSQFPTGVTVITTLDAKGDPVGVTASSFNAVSVEPPLILWSIDKASYSLKAFEQAEHFIVNVLDRNQVTTSNNFASQGKDKFSHAEYHPGLGQCPVLDHSAAQFECKKWAIYEGGDHLILVGEVVSYRFEDSVEPLIFSRGSYAVSAQHPETLKNSPTQAVETAQDFVSDYLLYLLRETYQHFSAQLYPKLKQECSVTPEEWRILAKMANTPSITISDLIVVVMQPERSLRETADWMVEKGHLEYLDNDTLKITEQGALLAKNLQALALSEEAELLNLLNDKQSRALKDNLKMLINKLDTKTR